LNGQAFNVSLIDGAGIFGLRTTVPATFALAPSDRRKFCNAGAGTLCIVVSG
jgi:hypothetical protein